MFGPPPDCHKAVARGLALNLDLGGLDRPPYGFGQCFLRAPEELRLGSTRMRWQRAKARKLRCREDIFPDAWMESVFALDIDPNSTDRMRSPDCRGDVPRG